MSTADLIAEGRDYAHKGKLPAPAHALILGLADALEAATSGQTVEALNNWQAGLNAGAALQPRVVSTVAELDALPPGSIVMDRFGSAFQNFDAGSWWMGVGDAMSSPQSAVIPATVLWVGGTE